MGQVLLLDTNVKCRGKLFKDIKSKVTETDIIFDMSKAKYYHGDIGIYIEDNGEQAPMFFVDGTGYIAFVIEILIEDEWKMIDLSTFKHTDEGISWNIVQGR